MNMKKETFYMIFFFVSLVFLITLLFYSLVLEHQIVMKSINYMIWTLIKGIMRGIGFSFLVFFMKEIIFCISLVAENYVFAIKACFKGFFLLYNQAFSSSFFVDFYTKKKNRLWALSIGSFC
jgi:hypothetical protein